MSNFMYVTMEDMKRPKDLIKYALHVQGWNEVARQARPGKKLTPLALQWAFVREEFEELCKALRERDYIEVVDAAMDLFVVASYAGVLSDLPTSRAQGAMMFDPEMSFSLIGLENHVYSCLEGEIPKTTQIHGAIKQITSLIYTLDVKIAYNMEEVLASNDSKYPYVQDIFNLHPGESGGDALALECKAIEQRSEGRYTGVWYSCVESNDGSRAVFFDSNGKIMKPSTFQGPNIIA